MAKCHTDSKPRPAGVTVSYSEYIRSWLP